MKPMATRTAHPRRPARGYTRVSENWHIVNLGGCVFFGQSRDAALARAGRYFRKSAGRQGQQT